MEKRKGVRVNKQMQHSLYLEYIKEGKENTQGKRILQYLKYNHNTSYQIIINCKCSAVHRTMTELRRYGFNITKATMVKGTTFMHYFWLKNRETERMYKKLTGK